jgi:ketosteroid isomerase-like protein
MKRRTLDVVFVVGGVALAVLLGVLGLVLRSNANFAKSYVTDQLSEQQITFPAAESLVKADAWKADVVESFGGDTAAAEKFIADNKLVAEADSACLVANAGQLMTTGKQAECYANDFIRLHVKDGSIIDGTPYTNSATKQPFEFKSYTYATMGGVARAAGAAVTAAKAANPNDPAIADLQAKATGINAQRESQFKGESLRGLLLTSYGFSIFGEKAAQASMVALLAGLVLLIASLAGLVHAMMTPKDRTVMAGRPDVGTPSMA